MQHMGQFISNHWELWLALIILLIIILVYEAFSQKKKAKALTPAAAVALINHQDAVVVDLREQSAFQEGHIINSVQATPDDFSTQKLSKYKGKPVILVCSRGLQSAPLATTLRTQGYTQTVVLEGGITAWQNAGLPLVKGR